MVYGFTESNAARLANRNAGVEPIHPGAVGATVNEQVGDIDVSDGLKKTGVRSESIGGPPATGS